MSREDRKQAGGAKKGTSKRDGSRTRDALVDAATACFREHGLHGMSLDAICSRAGFTRGAFYVHFGDRDDLVAAVMERATQAFLQDMTSAGAGAVPVEESVERFARAVVEGRASFLGPGAVRPQHLLDACASSAEVRKRFVDVLVHGTEVLSDAVGEGQGAGRLDVRLDRHACAQNMIAMVLGMQALADLGYPMRVDAMGRTLVASYLAGPPGGPEDPGRT